MSMEQMADLAGELAIPDGPAGLNGILQHLPRFAETLSQKMTALEEWMKEQRIHSEVTGPVGDLASEMSRIEDAATETYEAFLEHYEFWLGEH